MLEHDKVVVFFEVIEGCWLVATVAAIEALIFAKRIFVAYRSSTINELLLREVQKLTRLSKVGTLEGTDGGESPA